MKRIILALLILCSTLPAFAQPTSGDVFPPVGGPTDFWHTGGLLTSDRQIRLTYSDTLVLLYKTDGSIRYDTTKKQVKVYDGAYWRRLVDSAYLDTVVSSIEAGAVDTVNYIASITRLDREIDSVSNITDSLYTVMLTKQGADSLLLAELIATLQSDVVALDSALSIAFGAISNLYDTLPNYVDTAQLDDSLQVVKDLINLKQNYSDTTTWDATRYWVSTQIPSLSGYVDTAMLNDSLQAIKAAYVPYVGATTDVNLGNNNILLNSVRLSTSPTGTLTNVGQLYFDATNVTPAMPLNANVTLQIGQEEHVRARNNTGVQINDGQVVYINSAQGNNPTIALANSDSVNTSSVIGMATENIADNGTGFVTTFGVVNGYNTSGFNSGDVLYLNTVSGQLSNTIPTPPHNVVKVGIALNNTNNGKVFIQPSAPLGQDTTFAAPYNSNKVAPTQRAIGTYVRNITKDTASALRGAINTKLNSSDTASLSNRINLKYGTSDTGRAATNIATGGSLNKVRDSLNTLIATKGSGTVTSIQLVGGTNVTITPTTAITTSGVYTISATGGGGTPISASAYQMLYKSGGDTVRGTPRMRIDTTDNRFEFSFDSTTSTVSTDPHGGVKMWGSNRMGMGAVRINDTVSIPAALQRALNAQITSTITAGDNIKTTNTFAYGGLMQPGGTPTFAQAAYNATIQQFNYNRMIYTSSVGANQNGLLRVGNATQAAGLICGNTKFSGGGGRGTFMFALPTYLATERIMVGYWEGINPLTGDPSAFLVGSANLSSLMLIKDAADTSFQFCHYSGSGGVATKVNTGVVPNTEDVYRFTVYISPDSKFYMQLEIITKTAPIRVITYQPTTNVPIVGDRIFCQQGVNSGTVGGAVSYGLIQTTEEVY